MEALLDRSNDPFVAKARTKADKRRRSKELSDMRVLLEKPEFRRLMYRFLQRAHSFSGIFVSDAMTLSHNSGWQDAGFFFVNELQAASLAKFFLMLQEGLSDEQQAEATLAVDAAQQKEEAASRGEDTDS